MVEESITKELAALPAIEEVVDPGQAEDHNATTDNYKPIEQPRLNRAQRRALARYVKHRAALQLRKALARKASTRAAYAASRDRLCGRCGALFFGNAASRCQCKATMERRGNA